MDYIITHNKIIAYLAFFIILSCTTSKPVAVSPTKIQQQKTESSEAKNEDKEKTETAKTQNTIVEEHNKGTKNPNLPPDVVINTFKKNYPKVLDRSWTKVSAREVTANNSTEHYKVFFIIDNNKNWEVYTFSGELVETKVQILVDQLPPNIFSSIKTKYPEVQIMSAATYKNSSSNGSYSAVILTQKNAEPLEVILNENGSFVD